MKEENTDKVPYLRDFKLDPSEGTIVLDGELIAEWTDSDSNEVQKILGSTPERAMELYKEGYSLTYVAYDVLYKGSLNIANKWLYYRLWFLAELGTKLFKNCPHIKIAPTYIMPNVVAPNVSDYLQVTNILRAYAKYPEFFIPVSSYKWLLDQMYKGNKEGIILKYVFSDYTGTRSNSWKKFKQKASAELVLMGFVQPKKEYTGKKSRAELKVSNWKYWENGIPVSKTYALGLYAGIVLGAYNSAGVLEPVTTVKGFSESIQKEFKVGQVIEIEYQNLTEKSFRHPRFKCIRKDKNPEDCQLDTLFNH